MRATQTFATDQVVSDLGDSGLTPGQLRYALSQCQNSGGCTITFAVSGTINILQGGFVISKPVTIDAGANAIAVNGGGTSGASGTRGPVFFLQSGGAITLKNLSVTNFYNAFSDGGAISNGVAASAVIIDHCKFLNNQTAASSSGGAIYSLGPITITDSEFGSNKGGGGGALYPRFGSAVTISRCNFHDNQAINTSGGGNGGAILLWYGPHLTISSSTFTNNSAQQNGGGIAALSDSNNKSSVTVNAASSFSGNQARAGGGIHVLAQTTLSVDNTSFAQNKATNNGGGIENEGGATVTSCTFTANESQSGGGIYTGPQTVLNVDKSTFASNKVTIGDSRGGGVFNAGVATISNSTLSANTAFTDDPVHSRPIGGAIYNYADLTLVNCTVSGNMTSGLGGGLGVELGAIARMNNVTFSGNSAMIGGGAIWEGNPSGGISNTILANSPSGGNCAGVPFGNSSLSDDNTCGFGAGHDNVTNLLLGPLANNGGPTQTHLPHAGSAAIDAAGPGAPSTDQRGLPRPQGGGYDVGAVEVQLGESTPTPTPTPTPSPTPTATPPTRLGNIATRLRVETGDNILIGGFIITGTQAKTVVVRGIGPSLAQFFSGYLSDPVLELHDGSGQLLETNDNWVDSPNKQAIINSGLAPMNDLESAIIRTLPANNAGYTAIVRGVNNATGIGVVQIYDVDSSVDSKLANISSRGLVQTGDNVLFAGMIVVGQASQQVVVRATGPSLPVSGNLADPTLELHDGNGALLESNDNWADSPNKQAIINSGLAPTNDAESAIIRTLVPANYTAIVRGANDTTGIAVVEVYALN